ncbi:hypothetical protein Tco_0139013 [Tanacetum coccineum]
MGSLTRVRMEPDIENMTLNEYLMYEGRHRDLERSYTSRKRVAPEMSRVLSQRVDIDSMTLDEYDLYMAMQCSKNSDKDSSFEKILDDLFRIGDENLRMLERKVPNKCDEETVGDTDHESGNLVNFSTFPVTNEFASAYELDVDNINDNTVREEEEDEVKVEKQEEPDEEVASTLVQVSKKMNDVMQSLKEFREELLDITMVDKNADCNLITDLNEFSCIMQTYAESETLIQPLNSLYKGSQSLKLSTKTGMKWREMISPLKYNFNLSFPYPVAKLHPPGVYCYFYPYLISSEELNTLLLSNSNKNKRFVATANGKTNEVASAHS